MEGTQMLSLNKSVGIQLHLISFKWIVYRNMARIQRLKMRFICLIQLKVKRFLILDVEVGIRCNIWRNVVQKNCGDWISSTQIETAHETLQSWNPKLICGAMEEERDIPKGYFDIVYSIYALGWTSDLRKTLELIYSYVKPEGSFIFSWEHPVYSNLMYGTEEIAFSSSYHEETPIMFETFKGEDVQATLYKRKMSTYINELNRVGFTIERIEEPEPSSSFDEELAEPSTKYYSLHKARMVPTTFIIKARK